MGADGAGYSRQEFRVKKHISLGSITVNLRTTSSALPVKAKSYADSVIALFGLQEWEIVITLADNPGGRETADGCCWVSGRYLNARIEIRRDLNEERMRAVIMHELFHVVYGQMDVIVEDRVLELYP